ncbi:hypothetical protein CC1G_11729 [Coprinopsis cinerea okayama7|uniref:Uncharacterized protein n=1 Tax=Coprinopsis cinerea (strain Okayama-7 / 130 / ATCC MYA-4618 / FGSC 9003) TaxID=240176 RepID=A8NJY1_COPC7|nr:hypothetical protein CC1G_11729 [Coprinopsis cinerea okayama7\|eukprot:XP_001834320.1 hypothetical protein CC1G_11729 [Coprinopsis cinerea okayama7\
MFNSRSLAVAAFVAYVAAQATDDAGLGEQDFSISESCRNTISELASSPDARCLSASPLLPLFTSENPLNVEVAPLLKEWLPEMCSAPSCTNDNIAAIIDTATTGCEELAVSEEDKEGVQAMIELYYPIARRILCLKDGNDHCAVKIVEALQTEPLTIENIHRIMAVTEFGKDLLCSDCGKAIFNVLIEDYPGLSENTAVSGYVTNMCGANFTDGQDPLAQGSKSNSSDSNNDQADGSTDDESGVSRGLYFGAAASFVAIVASVVATLL